MSKKPKDLTVVHVFTFAFLTYAHLSDGELVESEARMILKMADDLTQDLRDAGQSISVARGPEIQTETVEWFQSLSPKDRMRDLAQIIIMLKEMPMAIRVRFINSLGIVAAADGVIHPGEVSMLEDIKSVLI